MASELKYLFLALLTCAYVAGQADPQSLLADQAEQQLRAGHAADAIELLNKAGEEKSTAHGEDRIGFLYAVAGKPDEAAVHLAKAIKTDANYASAHYHLGALLWLAKDQQHGLSELQDAVRLDPGVFDYHYRLGSAYAETGALDLAIVEFRKANGIDAMHGEVWSQLADTLRLKNDLAPAVEAMEKAVALKPGDNSFRVSYADLLIATRRPERAIEESRKVLATDKKNISAYLSIGHAYLKMGEFGEAEKAYREVIKIDNTSVVAHYDLGIALKMQDQIEAAQKEFERSIELDPNLAESHYTLGISDWQLGDFSGTITQMKAALAIRPDYAEAHYMLGIALKQSGDLDGALSELRESVRLDPTTPGPFNTMGQILRSKGDKAGSEQAFAMGAKLKREKDSQLANTLEQGMRGGMAPAPMTEKSKAGPK